MLNSILSLFLYLTVFLVSIIPAYFELGYEQIKVICFLLLTFCSGSIFTFLLYKKKVKIQWGRVKIASLVFFIILSVTSLAGVHPFESLTGEFPYFQGLILYWLLFLFFLIVSSVNFKWVLTVKFLSGAVLVVSTVAIFQFIFLNIFNIQIVSYAGRVVSTFGQPNLYSGFLLLSLPLVFRKNKFSYLVVSVTILAIILSFSRAAILLLVGLGIWFFVSRMRHKKFAVLLSILLISIGLVFSGEKLSAIFFNEIVIPLELGKNDNVDVEKRAHILPVMAEIASANLILGQGIDSIRFLYKERYANFSPEIIAYSPIEFHLKNLIIDRSHNYSLDLLIFSGVFGLLSYVCLIYLLFKRRSPGFLKVFLVLYLIWVQVQVQSVVHLILFWMVAGMIDRGKDLSDDD